MSLGDAKHWLTRQEGDAKVGWLTSERLLQMVAQIYADMELVPKHRSKTAYPAGAQVWWGDPPHIYTAPRQGLPANSPRPGEHGSLWLDGTTTLFRYSEHLPAIEAGVPVPITHGLFSEDILVQVWRSDGAALPNQPTIRIMGVNDLSLYFDGGYAAGELRVVILG